MGGRGGRTEENVRDKMSLPADRWVLTDIDCSRGTLTIHLHPVGPQRCHRLCGGSGGGGGIKAGQIRIDPKMYLFTFLMAVQSSRISRSCSM